MTYGTDNSTDNSQSGNSFVDVEETAYEFDLQDNEEDNEDKGDDPYFGSDNEEDNGDNLENNGDKDLQDNEDNLEKPIIEETDVSDAEPLKADPKMVIELSGGEVVTVQDLIGGNMRQQDYSVKTEAVQQQFAEMETTRDELELITKNVTEFVASQIPPEPDPNLLGVNPEAYTQQLLARQNAINAYETILGMQSETADNKSKSSDALHSATVKEELHKLKMLAPETATKEGKIDFFNKVGNAAKHLGFSNDDLRGITDHRIFMLAHWADKGLRAHKSRQTLNSKMGKGNRVTSNKVSSSSGKAKSDFSRLRKSGSIDDAMSLNDIDI